MTGLRKLRILESRRKLSRRRPLLPPRMPLHRKHCYTHAKSLGWLRAGIQLQGFPDLRRRGHRHAATGSSLNCSQSRKPVSATPVPPVANPAKHIRAGNHAVPKTDRRVAQSPRETASESSLFQQLFLSLKQSCVASLSPSSPLLSSLPPNCLLALPCSVDSGSYASSGDRTIC